MSVDLTARRNLELTETMRNKEKKGTLLWVLDKTKTAMGKRLIRKYIEQPLVNLAVITRRQNAVMELCSQSILRDELCEQLSKVYDFAAADDEGDLWFCQSTGAEGAFIHSGSAAKDQELTRSLNLLC